MRKQMELILRVLRRWDPRRLVRICGFAIGLSLAATGLAAGLFWLEDHLPRVTIWKARLAFLIVLEVVYGIAVTAVLLSVPILGILLQRARRRGTSGTKAARGLLLGGSLVAALVASEACAWIWLNRPEWFSVRPALGATAKPFRRVEARPYTPPDKVSFSNEFEQRSPGDPRDLLILGESSAEGVPYNFWVSIAHIVAWQLEATIPGLRVRPNVLANSGDTLDQQLYKLSIFTRRPDVVIVYCGHNEFSARFPWSREVDHYVDGKVPSLLTVMSRRLEEASPVCGLIRKAADKCRVAIPPPPAGYRSLVDVPAFTPEEYDALLKDFERRLEAMVGFAERLGAVPILIAPPANDSAYEPNRSYLPPRTTTAERAAFERAFLAIRRREDREPDRCLAEYRALLKQQPGFAETHYRVARLLERTGRWDEVYRHDRAARDLDGLPSRCPTRFQEVYRKVAARHRCTLIDGQAYFHKIGLHGLLDDHLFNDGLHPSLRGQIALAQAVLQAIRARGAFGWPTATPVPRIDPYTCAQHFELGQEVWRRVCLWGIMFYDLTAPARYDPSERNARSAGFAKAARRIETGEAPERVGLVNIGIPEAVPLVPDAASIPETPVADPAGPERRDPLPPS
jgi:lysophospholipase L1-like esterase